jgi:hypothetical protein
VMLDMFGDDHHADETQQEGTSQNYHYRIQQPMLPSSASQERRVMVSLPAVLIERLRNAAYWTGDRPLVDLVTDAIEHTVTQMEEVNGEAFPRRISPLKREAMTRNALSGPLN